MIIAGLLTFACRPTGPTASTAVGSPSASAAPATATPVATTATPSAAPSATPDRTILIQLGEHFFDPSSVKVKVGTTVVWRNNGQQTHDLHAYDGSFNSPPLDPGNIFTFTFTKPGLYRYYCRPHEGDGMTGQVDVE